MTHVWRAPTDTGWQILADPQQSEVTVVDANGAWQGRFPMQPLEVFTGRFAQRQNATTQDAFARSGPRLGWNPVTLTLPDGTSGHVQGSRSAGNRRKNKSAHVTIRGRSYTLNHLTKARAEVIRDGVVLGTLERHGVRSDDARVSRQLRQATDTTDELVLTIFEKVVKPGRPGAIDDFFSFLS